MTRRILPNIGASKTQRVVVVDDVLFQWCLNAYSLFSPLARMQFYFCSSKRDGCSSVAVAFADDGAEEFVRLVSDGPPRQLLEFYR
jgi:hypothetical protein